MTLACALWPPASPLPADPLIGRHEVLGMRRSCRAPQEPLKWWLNEKKEFGREHQCVPAALRCTTLPACHSCSLACLPACLPVGGLGE